MKIDNQKHASRRSTFFFLANRVIGTAPHHLSPAIGLVNSGRDVHILAPADGTGTLERDSPLESLLPPNRITWVPRGSTLVSRLFWYPRALFTSLKIIRRRKIDELYIYGSQICIVALLLILVKSRKTNVIYHTQDYLEPSRYPIRGLVERTVCRLADHVIVNERSRGRVMQSGYRLKKPPLVAATGLATNWPIPARSKELRKEILATVGPKDSGESILVIHQGPLREVRCGRELVGAMTLLPKNYYLVVTGMPEKDQQPFLAQVAANMRSRFIFLPNVGYQTLLAITASCDIGVLLYPNDGIGNFFQAPGRLSENSRCGIPSIASKFPSFELVNCDARILELCNPYDRKEIAGAILRLGKLGASQRAEISIAARAYSKQKLAIDRNIAVVLNTINNA